MSSFVFVEKDFNDIVWKEFHNPVFFGAYYEDEYMYPMKYTPHRDIIEYHRTEIVVKNQRLFLRDMNDIWKFKLFWWAHE